MPNNIFDILDQVIDSHFKIPCNHIIELEENQKSAKCKKVILKNIKRAYAFTLDKPGKDPFPFYNDLKGFKRKNDAIIFYEHNNKHYIFIIELKSDNPFSGIPQVKAGAHFVKYLEDSINLYNGSFPTSEIKYIIFNTRKNAQTKSYRKIGKANYKPISGINVAMIPGNNTYEMEYFI